MDVKVYPSRLAGEIRAVDSKSAAHRAIFAAALCQRPPELTIRDSSDDIRASLGAARAIREGRGEIDCAECGATLRFALPVAAALVPTDLKTNTGWFAGVVARLETGAKMHVLADCGDWLHVMLCDGEPGWLMDVHGVSGYLRKADVVQAGTSQQLDWLMAGK